MINLRILLIIFSSGLFAVAIPTWDELFLFVKTAQYPDWAYVFPKPYMAGIPMASAFLLPVMALRIGFRRMLKDVLLVAVAGPIVGIILTFISSNAYGFFSYLLVNFLWIAAYKTLPALIINCIVVALPIYFLSRGHDNVQQGKP